VVCSLPPPPPAPHARYRVDAHQLIAARAAQVRAALRTKVGADLASVEVLGYKTQVRGRGRGNTRFAFEHRATARLPQVVAGTNFKLHVKVNGAAPARAHAHRLRPPPHARCLASCLQARTSTPCASTARWMRMRLWRCRASRTATTCKTALDALTLTADVAGAKRIAARRGAHTAHSARQTDAPA